METRSLLIEMATNPRVVESGGSNKYIFWWMIVLLLLGRFGKGIKCSIIFAESGVLGRLVTHGN